MVGWDAVGKLEEEMGGDPRGREHLLKFGWIMSVIILKDQSE